MQVFQWNKKLLVKCYIRMKHTAKSNTKSIKTKEVKWLPKIKQQAEREGTEPKISDSSIPHGI